MMFRIQGVKVWV